MPGLVGLVESLELFPVKRRNAGRLFIVKLTGAVPQKLMESHEYEQRGVRVFKMKLFLFFSNVLKRLGSRFSVGVAEVDVLEAQMLSDLVVVGDVDADWDATGSEGEHIQAGEVRLLEHIALKGFSPRQVLERFFSAVD